MGEECAQYGPVVEMKVPTSDNDQCNIYVKFETAAAASAALQGLSGRKFDGREVEVALCAEEVFGALGDGM